MSAAALFFSRLPTKQKTKRQKFVNIRSESVVF